MAIEVFPTTSDIGGAGTGRSSTEETISQVLGIGIGQSSVLAGMAPSDGGGLTVTIAAGRCCIGGYIVRASSSEDVAVSDDTTGYLWLQLTGAASYDVTATAWIETADLTAPPANAALITKFVTSGGSVSSVQDRERREGEGILTGSYTGDGAANVHQEIDLGLTPRLVMARARVFAVGSDANFSISNIFPGNMEWTDFDESLIGLPWWFTISTSGGSPGVPATNFQPDANDSGGLGIIPNGFKAYNDHATTGWGMNRSGQAYDYIVWF